MNSEISLGEFIMKYWDNRPPLRMKLTVSIAFETVKMSWLFEGMQEWWTQQQDSQGQT